MLFIILVFCICELRGDKHRGQPREQKTDGVIIYRDQIDNIKKNHCEGRYLCSKDKNLRTTSHSNFSDVVRGSPIHRINTYSKESFRSLFHADSKTDWLMDRKKENGQIKLFQVRFFEERMYFRRLKKALSRKNKSYRQLLTFYI